MNVLCGLFILATAIFAVLFVMERGERNSVTHELNEEHQKIRDYAYDLTGIPIEAGRSSVDWLLASHAALRARVEPNKPSAQQVKMANTWWQAQCEARKGGADMEELLARYAIYAERLHVNRVLKEKK